MDFSQLPKMSKTPTSANSADAPLDETPPESAPTSTPRAMPAPATSRPVPEARVVYVQAPYESGFGGVWLSLIAGIIFLAMGQTFGRWLVASASGHDFVTGWLWEDGTPKAGQPKGYFDLTGGTAWTDAGLFLMGIALLLDAAILGILASRGTPIRTLVFVAIALTSVAMAINASVVAYLISIGITLPLTSLIALAVGGFVVFDHAPMLKKNS